ncbi:MAG TPA: STAS domain-containing protein [Frankiaceae bacterium]|nr:STAS domain-containing protein [Frankiaceae bacterium]
MREKHSDASDFAIRGPIFRADLPGLCHRVCDLLADRAGTEVSCDVASVPSDAVTVEALALLQLAARRRGCRIRLQGASEQLRGLVAFLGLRDVLSEESVSRPASAAD